MCAAFITVPKVTDEDELGSWWFVLSHKTKTIVVIGSSSSYIGTAVGAGLFNPTFLNIQVRSRIPHQLYFSIHNAQK